MSNQTAIPAGAAIAINDLLDHCAGIKPGQEVLLLAHIDGLYGGDNLVDQEAISWIQSAIHLRGANASVLWIDEHTEPYSWRLPPVVKAAMEGCDVLINHSFDITFEEITEFRKLLLERNKPVMVRNFATTAPLLCTAWAQTPHELVSEIRYQAALALKEGLNWQLSDDNGTHLEGTIKRILHTPTIDDSQPAIPLIRREDAGPYRPWPEWVHPPVELSNTSGIFVFSSMLSWWSRYIGISPYFRTPVSLTVEDGRIIKIDGGDEADALRGFLASMFKRFGDEVYDLNILHSGVHPQASVGPQQCPSPLYRRLIEHSHSSNLHVHIGALVTNPAYPFWMHCTGDIRTATLRVGDTLFHDRGHLIALDHPQVLAVAAKYPGRPGLEPEPRSY
jgi:hypothetical protein